MKYLFFLAFLFFTIGINAQTISGKIADKGSGEDLPFALVYVKGSTKGTTSNVYGFYSLSISPEDIKNGKVTIVFSFTGYEKTEMEIEISSDVTLNIRLQSSSTRLTEFTVEATKSKEVEELRSTKMSTDKLEMEQMKTLPSIGGEVDIIKIAQLLPGIQGGTEGGTGMFVRGGDADQNLVILDEAIVYNIGHLFGFFSVFNPEAIKDMTIIKGAFPSQYGGRLSSVLDVRMKNGNDTKFHGSGGVGLLSSRLTLEMPIKKEKGSILIAGRRTYIDKVLKAVGQELPYYFYDLNVKANYQITKKDRLFYSMYYGKDVLAFGEEETDSSGNSSTFDFGFNLGNWTNTVRWNHIYSPKLFSNLSLINTNFDYEIYGNIVNNKVIISSNVVDFGAKMDFDYFKSPEIKIKFGGAVTNHAFKPNIITTEGDISDFIGSSEGKKLVTQEMALYGNIEQEINPLLKINYGLRLTGSTVKDKFYAGIEPRLAGRYMLNEFDVLKVSYSRMKQYMHRVSNSTIALPTDLWYPITENIKPQISDQVALGYNHLFNKNKLTFSAEVYYKWLQNLIEYREGASLVLNNDFESELIQGTGDAWGLELMIKKERGKFTGWIAYTLSWATRDFDELNGGETYWAKYDRRHTGSVVMTYKLAKRWTASAVWVYQTGSRFTAQNGQYFMPNPTLTGVDIIPIYSARNGVQMSSSHRLDLNFVLQGRKNRLFGNKKKKYVTGEWHFGCYNLYNQAQPYRVNIVATENGGYKYEQPGLFGFIPSVAYNFKF
ncbi:TonB-dependent receptor [Flavobacteriales bacterium]|nr:TonB-dependent receptor [Flavobacteriales bacterium]